MHELLLLKIRCPGSWIQHHFKPAKDCADPCLNVLRRTAVGYPSCWREGLPFNEITECDITDTSARSFTYLRLAVRQQHNHHLERWIGPESVTFDTNVDTEFNVKSSSPMLGLLGEFSPSSVDMFFLVQQPKTNGCLVLSLRNCVS